MAELLRARAPREVRNHRPGKPGPRREVLRLVQRGLRRRRPQRAREGADRAGRGSRRPVPLLHRRVHEDVPREGLRSRADDGSGPRGLGHPGWRLAGPRRPDARARTARGNGGVTPPGAGAARPRPRNPGRGPQGNAQPPRPRLPARVDRGPAPAPRRRCGYRAASSRRPSGPAAGPSSGRRPLEIFQINVGRLCNMTCRHCHVDAGPDRVAENMDRETVDLCLAALDRTTAHTVDITGGAPELNPHFRYLVDQSVARGKHVMDRCNLTILLLPRCADLPEWLAARGVEIVSSLPHYRRLNTDAQRGDGTFDRSIEALRRLNAAGYGQGDPRRRLTLVSNPAGAFLPGGQASLERDWKAGLARHHGVTFDRLFTLSQHADQSLPRLARRERQSPGVHGAAGGDLQPGGRPGPHVPQHDLGRLGRHAPRLRLQPDARSPGREPSRAPPSRAGPRPRVARARAGSARRGTASGARRAPEAPAAAPRREPAAEAAPRTTSTIARWSGTSTRPAGRTRSRRGGTTSSWSARGRRGSWRRRAPRASAPGSPWSSGTSWAAIAWSRAACPRRR